MNFNLKSCVLGHVGTIEKGSISERHLNNKRECSQEGYLCKCGQFSCRKCVGALAEEMCKLPSYKSDKVGKAYQNYLDNGVSSDICHCCWMRVDYRSSSRRRSNYIEMCKKPMTGDGYVVLEQFGIAIDTPMMENGTYDIHGFAAEATSDLESVTHFVISPECAVCLHASNAKCQVFPAAGSASGNKKIQRLHPVVIDYPNYQDRNKTDKITVDIIIVDCLSAEHFFMVDQGDNSISVPDFESLFLFTSDDKDGVGVDLTLILGRWPSDHGNGVYKPSMSLLLARFHEGIEEVNIMTDAKKQEFYKDVMNATMNNGFVRKRCDGSSGVFKAVTPEMLGLIRGNRGCCPRTGRGQWWMPNGLEMVLGYISSKGNAVAVEYSIPQIGGQLDMNPAFGLNYKMLLDCAECKVRLALLLESLNSMFAKFGIQISPSAVAEEVRNVNKCVLLGDIVTMNGKQRLSDNWYYVNSKVKKKSQVTKASKGRPTKEGKRMIVRPTRREAVLGNHVSFNRRTVVHHAVGSHNDSWESRRRRARSGGVSSLEGRTCINHKSLFNKHGVGRGGGGSGNFVFGLLDWQRCSSDDRRKAVYNCMPKKQCPKVVRKDWWDNTFAPLHVSVAKAVDRTNIQTDPKEARTRSQKILY